MRGSNLDPCKNQKARQLLKEKKAKIISYKPFTIQMLIPTGETTHESHVGIDLGAKYTGVAITQEDRVLAKGDIECRQDIKGLLETKKIYRRSRRSRKTRYRKCKFKHKTTRVYSNKKGKWVKKKTAFTSSRPKGWLPPSLESRTQNVFFWIDTFTSLLPKVKLHIEVGKFDVQKMKNPGIQGKAYQEGDTFGYHDVRYFVFARDSYTCQVCKKKGKILNTHHIIYRSHGGTDAPSNLISVCTDCHTSDNHKRGHILWHWMEKRKKVPTYKEPPFMNALRIRTFRRYPDARIIYGSETTPRRKALHLEKTHYNDAIAISGIQHIKENPHTIFYIKQFRKKKRSLHEATARKGRKNKNLTQKRNKKNTKEMKGIHLNDTVRIFGKIGFVSGFTTTGLYIKDIHNVYITKPRKTYKQVGFKDVTVKNHNNNWQFISHLAPDGA